MEFISAVKDGFKNYANTKAIATRSQLYYWFIFALISLMFFNLLDIIIFDVLISFSSKLYDSKQIYFKKNKLYLHHFLLRLRHKS